ncbi:uncharacterized protein LOC126785926 [Argentina anserina]|uniref:uncharacterized protein LOC126785926 n=1 Tax=Argentina anserina TaxID=57926 RepID=UPI00217633CF|nr:uncharacterized protein LOC126785926 [Potentilla anserina]
MLVRLIAILMLYRKRRELKTAEFAEGIIASLTRNQDETPGLKQQKVCNFFIKKSCSIKRTKSIFNQMIQVEGQAIGMHILPEETTAGMQNKEKPSSLKFDVEGNEERKKRRITSE